MKIKLLFVAFLLAACAPPSNIQSGGERQVPQGFEAGIVRYHDDELNVTCWTFYTYGIDCIPDWQLEAPNE